MSTLHTAFVALGANLGQRAANIKEACAVLRQLSRSPIATSFLYETPPAYVLDQPSFVNAVVKITTELGPERLLEELKNSENKLGRIKTRRFGERAIDMDIVLYDDVILDTTDLTIPHPRMQEREFVLRPLCEVAPVIRALRTAGLTTPISIDTFHSSVAKAAIEAGADIINDVTGGQGDPLMLQTAATLDVPIILMHMRGDPGTMNKMNVYEGNDVIPAVRAELEERVEKALEAGISRWNLVVDPGLGFAKTGEHNLQLLRNSANLLDGTPLAQYPMLMGPSRKKFLGTLAGKVDAPAKERDWGTAAAVSACVAGGVDFVRVHNVEAMADVVAVGNAIWRPRQ